MKICISLQLLEFFEPEIRKKSQWQSQTWHWVTRDSHGMNACLVWQCMAISSHFCSRTIVKHHELLIYALLQVMFIPFIHRHTHTHTHIYIYIYATPPHQNPPLHESTCMSMCEQTHCTLQLIVQWVWSLEILWADVDLLLMPYMVIKLTAHFS